MFLSYYKVYYSSMQLPYLIYNKCQNIKILIFVCAMEISCNAYNCYRIPPPEILIPVYAMYGAVSMIINRNCCLSQMYILVYAGSSITGDIDFFLQKSSLWTQHISIILCITCHSAIVIIFLNNFRKLKSL